MTGNNNKRFFNLSDITARIQAILQPHIGKQFWVKAEISSGRERGGSFYCDLVESDESGKIIAQMRCTIWNRDLANIRRQFKEYDLDLKLDDGTAVGFQCSLQYHPQFGLSLKVVGADPAFALGELELKKKEILDRLTKEGLLEPNKRLHVPMLPQRIGLITSKGSAACNDILKTLSSSDFGFKIFLADSTVQGLKTELSVLEALDALERLNLDLVIIARGGGSKTDLFYLDNEAIARRIAGYEYPVRTGIGHETDISILDHVANRYFKTPTTVAEEIVARFVEMKRHLEEAENRFRSTWTYRFDKDNKWLEDAKVHIGKIYGAEHEVTKALSQKLLPENVNTTQELENRTQLLESYVDTIEALGIKAFLKENMGSRIFIGHGRSPIWRELKDFLSSRLNLQWDEFNRESVAGITTFNRISEMLDSASFAFLIMTAEDQHSDEKTHARQNVVHEVGLFQGRLGPRKAIILLEEGCSEFSNIVGLSQIRFPRGYISAVFENIRRVLEREGVMKT